MNKGVIGLMIEGDKPKTERCSCEGLLPHLVILEYSRYQRYVRNFERYGEHVKMFCFFEKITRFSCTNDVTVDGYMWLGGSRS